MNPFITFYTPTYRRPQGLARCLESVRVQTAVADIEQIVIPDHLGRGIVGGMYAPVPHYFGAVHGQYVAFLADDDELAEPTVVEQLRHCVEANGHPPLILTQTMKGGSLWPDGAWWPPRCGAIDLNCAIVRADLWRTYAPALSARNRYEGDYDWLKAMADDGVEPVKLPILFSIGGVSRGAAEAA